MVKKGSFSVKNCWKGFGRMGSKLKKSRGLSWVFSMVVLKLINKVNIVQNGRNWENLSTNNFSIIPWQGFFYDLFFFFPFPFCPRFFSLLRACCNFLASLSAFFSALIASRRFSRNIDESQVGLLRYGLSSAKVRTRRRWLMFLHNRLSSRRNFWNQN